MSHPIGEEWSDVGFGFGFDCSRGEDVLFVGMVVGSVACGRG